MTVVLHARIHGRPGQAEQLAALLADHVRETTSAPGNLGAVAYAEIGAPDTFALVMTWADEDAVSAHYESAAYGRYSDAVTALLAAPSEVEIHHVSQTTRPVPDLSLDPRRQD
ncbi:MAG: antibiotic biosynthesis monooxygenase [Solirubrobacteraceae bacterium]|nr:antibiotic biosynthesis monooxygenase [Solirubrobacteraceae bacterium]